MKKLFKRLFLICTAIVAGFCATAQCSSPISSFPFLEDFEATNGGWVIAGSNSDWAWGAPQKSIINAAYSGSNAWVVGGLTGNSYNGNEASWIQSPCFNFSALQKPLITFSIRWESEQGWDGTGFQYSLNNGSTWNDVGSTTDPRDCLNENWFNTSSVRFLNGLMQSGNGWTGSSGGWVLAKKALASVAGKNNVIFRFVFASGSQANNYNGVAIDDFGVSDAPPSLSVTSTITSPINCHGDKNGVITTTASGAPGPYTYTWNTNPVQTDATATNLSAGTYSVIVSAPNSCSVSSIITLTEPAPLAHTITSINPGCIAASGSISISETGGTSPYTYNWSPNVSTTSSAIGLAVGPYNITVTDSRSCTDVFDIDIVNVFPPTVNISNITDVKCNGGNNGAATATITGGLDPITYSWNTNPVQTDLTAINLKAGDYLFTVKDANNCTVTTPVNINEPAPITTSVQINNTTCGLRNGSITITPSGNSSDYQYLWTPNISTGNNAVSIPSGRYSVQLVNANGCSKDINNIIVPNIGSPSKIFLGKDTTICSGETTTLSPGTFDTYLWQNNSANATFSVAQSGKYWVRVTNADGCVSSDTINVKYVDDCIDIYFPNSFSPNGDGLNDQFGPVGNFNAVSNYTLTVYNRWGQQVFVSTDPRKKWSGENNGQISATANYIWFSTYTFRGQGTKFKKGSVIIVR